MSDVSKLYSGLKRMIKDRIAEHKMLETMVEAMESIPNMEAEISRLNREKGLCASQTEEVRAEWKKAKATHDANLLQMQEDIRSSMLAVEAQKAADKATMEETRLGNKEAVDKMKAEFVAEQNKYQTAMEQIGHSLRETQTNADKQAEELKKEVFEWEKRLSDAKAAYAEFKAKV